MDWQAALNWVAENQSKEVVGVVVTVLALVLFRFAWRQLLIFQRFWNSRSRALNAVKRDRTRDGWREGKGLWLQQTFKPERYEDNFGTNVLVIANNKGGVAKTTLAANLGAFWAKEWNKRVLLIDVDYQATLTNMALRTIREALSKEQDSLANCAISGDLEPNLLVQCAKEIPGQPNLKIIPSGYDLAQADNRLIVEWLLQCAPGRPKQIYRLLSDLLIGRLFVLKDVRYNLHDLLQTKAVREAFDIVIIDCPPRFTTGVVQALCAGKNILVPTILDQYSAESVVRFCRDLETLKKNDICPHLGYVGIVGTKVSPNVGWLAENEALRTVTDSLQAVGLEVPVLNPQLFMRQYQALVNTSDSGIAYLSMGNTNQEIQIKQAIGDLALYVASRIGLVGPPANVALTNGARITAQVATEAQNTGAEA